MFKRYWLAIVLAMLAVALILIPNFISLFVIYVITGTFLLLLGILLKLNKINWKKHLKSRKKVGLTIVGIIGIVIFLLIPLIYCTVMPVVIFPLSWGMGPTYSSCTEDLAIDLSNSVYCNFLGTEEKNRCMYEVGIKSVNANVCSNIDQESKYHDWCYAEIAALTYNETVCQLMNNPNNCYNRFYIYGTATEEMCEKLQYPSYRENCLNEIKITVNSTREQIDSNCRVVQNEECYTAVVGLIKDENFCDNIVKNPYLKKTCLNNARN